MKMGKTILFKVNLFSTSSNLSTHYHNYETQMRQLATFRGDYLYPIAHLYIIISTEGAT